MTPSQPVRTPPNPILVALLVALAVFTLGLIGITIGLRAFSPRPTPTPTPDLAGIPLTPLATVTLPPEQTPTSTPSTPTPTLTTSPTPTPTATLQPTDTPTPTPLPSATPTPPPTPYAGPFRNNGGDYVASKRGGFIIDGFPGEWGSTPAMPLTRIQQGPENFSGPQDFAAAARLAWDDNNLYLLYEVTDDIHVQELNSYELFNGDEVELWLDANLALDFNDNNLNGDDYQFGFSAGRTPGAGAEGVVWYPQRRGDWNNQIMVAAQPQGQGYVLEAAIPWSILGLQPLSGMALGYALSASDNDTPGSAAQQTILVHTPGMAFGQPATFSNLRLQ